MQPLSSFQFFPILLPEIQCKFLKYTDSRTSFQLLNREWCERASITSSEMFDNDLAGLSKERMIRVLIHAAYAEKYEGVENILKNSSLLQLTKNDNSNFMFHHYIDCAGKRKIIDFYTIIANKQEKKWLDLLSRYNIVEASNSLDSIAIDPFIMSCLAGNSYAMRSVVCDASVNLEDALYIAINCGYYSCVKTLIDIIYDVSKWDFYMPNTLLLFSLDTLQFACSKKNIKIIEEILKTKQFDINEVYGIMLTTFLDRFLKNAKNDDEYNDIIFLLKQYGAKTLQEINEENDNDVYDAIRAFTCIIS